MANPTDNKRLTAIGEFFEAGVSIAEIADMLGLHKSTVHRILVKLRVKESCPAKAKRLTAEQKVDILEMYKDGVTVEHIMELLGCSKPTVYRYVNEVGLSRDIAEDAVAQALDAYLNTKQSVSEICEQYGLSKATFYRRLKAHTAK